MSYSENVTKNDLKEVFTQLGLGVSFGQIYEAAWTATSTNSTPQRCTDSIYLPKGKYIGVIKLPITSQESTLFFGINGMSTTVGGFVSKSQSIIPIIFEVDTDNRETYVVTGMSQATTYTYIDRGYLKVICISDMKQYGTTVLDYWPVGSYYETSDSNFNPNNSWGGTWELETEGQFHISGSTSGIYIVGTSGGSTKHKHGTQGHTLTVDEMPSHRHQTDKWVLASASTAVFSNTPKYYGGNYETVYTNYVGGGKSHSHGDTYETTTLPPYMPVYRWHRTA